MDDRFRKGISLLNDIARQELARGPRADGRCGCALAPSIRRSEKRKARTEMARSKITPELAKEAKILGGKVAQGQVNPTAFPGRFEYRAWGLTKEEVLQTAAFIKALRPLPKED